MAKSYKEAELIEYWPDQNFFSATKQFVGSHSL